MCLWPMFGYVRTTKMSTTAAATTDSLKRSTCAKWCRDIPKGFFTLDNMHILGQSMGVQYSSVFYVALPQNNIRNKESLIMTHNVQENFLSAFSSMMKFSVPTTIHLKTEKHTSFFHFKFVFLREMLFECNDSIQERKSKRIYSNANTIVFKAFLTKAYDVNLIIIHLNLFLFRQQNIQIDAKTFVLDFLRPYHFLAFDYGMLLSWFKMIFDILCWWKREK